MSSPCTTTVQPADGYPQRRLFSLTGALRYAYAMTPATLPGRHPAAPPVSNTTRPGVWRIELADGTAVLATILSSQDDLAAILPQLEQRGVLVADRRGCLISIMHDRPVAVWRE